MIFPIIVCFFGCAYGLKYNQYNPGYEGYVRSKSKPQGSVGTITIKDFQKVVEDNKGQVIIVSPHFNGNIRHRLAYNPAYSSLEYEPNLSALDSQYVVNNNNGNNVFRLEARYERGKQAPVSAQIVTIPTYLNEAKAQSVQPIGLVQNVIQPIGVVSNVPQFRVEPVVSNSYQPIIGTLSMDFPFKDITKKISGLMGGFGTMLTILPQYLFSEEQTPKSGQYVQPQIIKRRYSEQLPVESSVPYSRSIDTPIASNVGIASQFTGVYNGNGFVLRGLVGANAAGGRRSTIVQK